MVTKWSLLTSVHFRPVERLHAEARSSAPRLVLIARSTAVYRACRRGSLFGQVLNLPRIAQHRGDGTENEALGLRLRLAVEVIVGCHAPYGVYSSHYAPWARVLTNITALVTVSISRPEAVGLRQ